MLIIISFLPHGTYGAVGLQQRVSGKSGTELEAVASNMIGMLAKLNGTLWSLCGYVFESFGASRALEKGFCRSDWRTKTPLPGRIEKPASRSA